MIKNLLIAVLLLGPFFCGISYACHEGDTSKILLVIADTQDGQENAVVGEIRTSDGSIQMLRSSYDLIGTNGNWIYVKNRWSGLNFKFNRLAAVDSVFCFKAIFSE